MGSVQSRVLLIIGWNVPYPIGTKARIENSNNDMMPMSMATPMPYPLNSMRPILMLLLS
jgi:hypothetical protein